MSLNVNCCEGLNIQKILCNCHWTKKPPQREQQVLYTDRDEQIVILSTPHFEIPDLVVYGDIHRTDIVIFTLDQNSDIRFTSVHGQSLLTSIERKPKPPTPNDAASGGPHPPQSARRDASVIRREASQPRKEPDDQKDHRAHPSIAHPEDIAGRALKDVLPEYMLKFLLPICKETLKGEFMQLTIMWRGLTQLVRTYPVPQNNRKRNIIAGMLTISPFVSAFNVDVNRFSVGNLTDQQPLPQLLPDPVRTVPPTHQDMLAATRTDPPPTRSFPP